ncbi:hypothetical protein EON65_53630 [archaeon]|nr:MAG: hypothetical protein EON65_53630 [archaeon]
MHVTLQARRDARAKQDVAEESVFWITESNVDTKITEKLFEAPGHTTGLSYAFSNSLQYQTFVPTIFRMLTDEQYQNQANSPDNEDYMHAAKESDKEVMKRLLVENFVKESIGVASEREAYEDIVQVCLGIGICTGLHHASCPCTIHHAQYITPYTVHHIPCILHHFALPPIIRTSCRRRTLCISSTRSTC